MITLFVDKIISAFLCSVFSSVFVRVAANISCKKFFLEFCIVFIVIG